MKLKFGIIVFPGSNCDDDVVYVIKDILDQEAVKIWHKDTDLQNVDGIIIPGGFSYGDYLRAGGLAKFSPVMASIENFAKKGGFVFGICNGFQILCEAGLLPGTLLANDNNRFISKNVYIKVDNRHTMLTNQIDSEYILKIPIAHAEGKYYAPPETITKMRRNGQILFRYCDEFGRLTEEANPNGSVENIAGICNEEKNVYGMMPHPERAADDELGNTDGLLVFKSILHSLTQKIFY